MKNLVLFSLVLFVSSSYSQLIKGKIVDEDKGPIIGANVYFDGTTIGTISDLNGNFTLNYSSKINSIMAVSCMGYRTEYISNFYAEKELFITLNPVINSLKEVIVTKDGFSRKQKMQLFRQQFLGRTPFGKKAIIQNEEDIYFEYNKVTRTLKAFSDEPLIINNSSLGYTINYELVNFETRFHKLSMSSEDVTKSYYAGLSRFEDVENSTKILRRRAKNFQGSQLQFFRNLVTNVWNKENFLLFKGSFQVNPKDYFTITDTLNLKKVVIAKQERGLYNRQFVAEFNLLHKKSAQSKIIFETNSFYVDKFGNTSNIENILFSGKLMEQKVGDMLPLNYGIK